MRTPKHNILTVLALAAMAMLPDSTAAQRINILGISGGGTSGLMKAELADLPEGREIASVTTRRHQMSTGYDFPKEDSYKLYGGKYIVADLDYLEGEDYYYSLEVTLDDGTLLTTDMYNTGYTEGAVWASDIAKEFKNATNPDGDFTWFSSPRPYTGVNHTPVTPEDTGRPLRIHTTSDFKNGISLRATANGTQDATLNVAKRNEHGVDFTRVMFTFGLQADAIPGTAHSTTACRIIFKVNGAETGWKGNMKAATNGGNPYFFNATQAQNPITTIGLSSLHGGVNNVAVLGALRLYYPVPKSTKTAQTVVFDTPGGKILPNDPDIDLSAYSTADTPVYFTILQGSDIAELKDGHILCPMRDKTGEVVVEAFTLGDDTHAPASATQTWSFKFGPTVEYLDTRVNEAGEKIMYVYAETGKKALEELSLNIYDNVRSVNVVRRVEYVSQGLEKFATHAPNVYALPLGAISGDMPLYSLDYKFVGDPKVTGVLTEGGEAVYFLKGTDVNTTKGQIGAPSYVSNNTLQTGGGTYRYGFSVSVGGSIETKPAMDLSQFSRFAADLGGHTNGDGLPGNVSFVLYNGTSQAYLNTGNIGHSDMRYWNFPLKATEAGKTVKITTNGGFLAQAAIGAPRFYYKANVDKGPQEIQWVPELAISNFRPFKETLAARSTAGLPIFYRVVSGGEFASIENDTILSLNKIPQVEAQIVVEAYSPGDRYYCQAEPVQCVYHLTPTLYIPKEQVLELEPGSLVGDMVIFGDAQTCGQVVVKDGVVNVDNLTLRFTFRPGEWTYISFPSDLDLDAISDLGAKGFAYSTADGQPGTYMLREYDTEGRASNPDSDPWRLPAEPHVSALKGYMMKVETGDTKPVEISFKMQNMELDFTNKVQAMNLTVDMSKCEPETRHTVYVRPTNVKGNTLRVDVRYVPTDYSKHVNHARALEGMRVTYSQDRSSIRLTLPDQSPAKVAFFDKKGKKLVKAVRYVSPMRIDVSDMPHDTYRMVVIYGPASVERLVEL